VPIGHGNSFRLVLESHGKVMENAFPKRVVTLQGERLGTPAARAGLRHV